MKSRMKSLVSLLLTLAVCLTAAFSLAEGQTLDFNQMSGEVLISKAGNYTLTGSLNGHVLVDVGEGEVTLTLSGVNIASPDTAGLIAVSGSGLTVVLADGTENTIADGGSDETYDAAVISSVPLTFEGTGSLTVVGSNQEGISSQNTDLTFNGGHYTVISQDDGIGAGGDQGGLLTFNGGSFSISASGDGIDSNASAVFNGADIFVVGSAAGGDAGIDTDGGYTILSGTVVALGSDMIETPGAQTTQATLALTLDSTVAEGSQVQVVTAGGETLAAFEAVQSFRTLILSSADLAGQTCSMLVNGEAVSAAGETSFAMTDTVVSIGASGMGGHGGMGRMGFGGRPDGERPELPEGAAPAEGMPEPPEGMGNPPEGMPEPPEGMGNPPEGMPTPPDHQTGSAGT